MIGKRLKLARQSAGLSLRELEAELQERVSAQAIGKYERDEMMPSSEVLMSLAHALSVPETYLVGQGEVELEGVEFRKNSIGSKRDDAQVKALVLDHVQRYLEIEEVLGLDSKNWEQPAWAPYLVRNLQDAEYVADKLRNEWKLGGDGIPYVAELLEEHGIKVLDIDIPGSVAGLTASVVGAKAPNARVVVVNRKDTGERQRFTLCHELGHLLLKVEEGVDEEKAAHRFASAFLMPSDILQREIGKHRSSVGIAELLALKPMFRVSIQAIAYRLRDLEIISKANFKALFDEFEEKGWRKPPFQEPLPVVPERPRRFYRLCLRALGENLVSESKGAELLRVKVRDLDRFYVNAAETIQNLG